MGRVLLCKRLVQRQPLVGVDEQKTIVRRNGFAEAPGSEVGGSLGVSFRTAGNEVAWSEYQRKETTQTQEWLEHRQAAMQHVPYLHITVTVPAELRGVLHAHQRDGYAVLIQAAAAAIIELDPSHQLWHRHESS